MVLRDNVPEELQRATQKMGQAWVDQVAKKLTDDMDELIQVEKVSPVCIIINTQG